MIIHCGSLSVIGSHKPIGSGIISRFSFIGMGMVSLEGVSHCGGRL